MKNPELCAPRSALVVLVGALAAGACAQDNTCAVELRRFCEREVTKLLEQTGEPGLAVVMIENGEAAYCAGFGVTAWKDGQPVTPGTLFNVGSISKTFTAWATMRLVEQDKLSLDDTFANKVTSWQLPKSQFDHEQVTVGRLLRHTAGISQPSIAGFWPDEKLPDLIAELDQHVRVSSEPGREFAYSGGGYTMLQLLVQEVAGRSFAEFAHDEVFATLAMGATSFDQSTSKQAATPHQAVDSSETTGRVPPIRHRLFTAVAGAGLYTTAHDMGLFLAAHCGGAKGGVVGGGVLKPETLASMWRPDAIAKQYGLGYEVPPPAGPFAVVMHSGSNFGWKANFMVLPEMGLGIAVLTNCSPGQTRLAVLREFRDLIQARIRDR